jgi:hypothetical protein
LSEGKGMDIIMIEPEEEIALVLFAVEEVLFSEPEFININGRVANLLMSSFINNF